AGGHSATIYPDGRIRGDRKFSLLVNALGSVWRKFYESRSTLDKADHWRIQLDWVPTTVPTSRSTLATCLTIRKAAFSSAWRFRMEKCAMFSIRSRPTLI
ncbi:hypothetical protein, partial [Ralstonia solanacearum]|uniref:hypothetical protein n=1 Tax=Ralstonia pseudosolanacearum TaxID=1310165 RepID=UPI001AEBC277